MWRSTWSWSRVLKSPRLGSVALVTLILVALVLGRVLGILILIVTVNDNYC